MRERLPYSKKATQTVLFLTDRPVQFLAIAFSGLFPKTNAGAQRTMVMMYRFSRPMEAKLGRRKTANTITKSFLKDWLTNFRILLKFLTDSGAKFTSKFFQVFGEELGGEAVNNYGVLLPV